MDDDAVARVQELTQRLESLEDPAARELGEELVAAVVQMYGEGLERIVAEMPPDTLSTLAHDGVVASLLLIHDLYPVPVEARVLEALERVRPYMESHGGDVEFLGVHEGIAHLRLQGSCKSCSASSATLELAVRQALEEAAPDLEGMEVEGVVEPEPEGDGFVLPLTKWYELDGAAAPAPEGMATTEVGGIALLVANVEGTLLAYRDRCADCGERLDDASLSAGALTCARCKRSYFLPRAGRSLDDDGLQLEPVPLLRENGSVRVALSA